MQPLNATEFLQSLPPQGRLLGVDHGTKRIGLALSDVSRRFVNPLEVLTAAKFTQNAQALQRVVAEHQVVGLVIGYPLNMDGSAGPRCQSVRAFARALREFVPLPMLLWDERLSSQTAHHQMVEGGLRAAQRGDKVDKLAAAAILQSFLDSFAE